KRFYKGTEVVQADDGAYEIKLDQRKLKTPKGDILKVKSELLAFAVAAEWDAQQDEIQQSIMHLTSLCMTAQDNPHHITKYDAVHGIVNFLESDTILFFSSEEELYRLQEKEWGPVISWFCKRFNVDLYSTRDIANINLSLETKQTLQNHLLCYSLTAIHGFLFAVGNLKSLILTLSCVERQISVERAVLLQRLEEEYQAGYWGRVEWAHDVGQLDSEARLAAAIIFIHLNSPFKVNKCKSQSVIK
ncbi:hypothetical protein AAG570_001903, partial [Ranatra chinensis]